MIKVFAFDLFGTLVDLRPVSKVFSELNIKIDNPKLFTDMAIKTASVCLVVKFHK
jgi:FMN phosphatase YigB (HAD superfamily)